MGPGSWRSALLVGIILVAAADEQYVIWRSSAVNGFTWEPASGTYASKDACAEAIEGRRRRIARALGDLGSDAVYMAPEARELVEGSRPARRLTSSG